jgi:hypothetical protein
MKGLLSDVWKPVVVAIVTAAVLTLAGWSGKVAIWEARDSQPDGGIAGRISRQEDRYDQLARRVSELERTRDEERRLIQATLNMMGERLAKIEAQLEMVNRTLGARGEQLR